MITPAYAPTATERVLPRLALDFTTGTLDPRVTVTRALNTATRVNSSGLIEVVNADLPRFDYDPVTLAPKGLLIEEARTNLLPNSETFAGGWTPEGASVQTVSITPPNNAASCKKLVENTAAGAHGLYAGATVTNVIHAGSLWVKAAERTKINLFIFDVTGSKAYEVKVDLTNGTVIGTPTGTWEIEPFPNGWYRISIVSTVALAAGASRLWVRILNAAGNASYTGDGTSGVYLWGAQLEPGASATSYIPTTTTSLTRNADVESMTGANFSSWWQVTTGGMLVRARQSAVTGIRPWAHISDGTADNIISLRGNAANPELYIKATTDQAQIDAGTLAANTSYGLASAWNTNDCAAAINGGTAVVDTSVTIPTVDRMLIGSDGANYLNGWVEKIELWPQRIINAEVQAFSK